VTPNWKGVLLVERGWLTVEERSHVEFLLDRKLKNYRGYVSGVANVPDLCLAWFEDTICKPAGASARAQAGTDF
jgi:hypothetical protein